MRALALLFALLSAPAWAAMTPPVRMKFVDAETNVPVEGAVVLFHGTAREGTVTGRGGKLATLFLVEAVTDANGDVRIPAQEFSANPFQVGANHEAPLMMVLHSGYRLELLRNARRGTPDAAQDLTHWDYNGQTRQLRRWAGEAELRQIVASVDLYLKAMLGAPCDWQRIPRTLVMTERIANDWERMRVAGTDPALRGQRPIITPLSAILRNESFYQQQGCGSPRAFFAPYLR